MMMAYREYILNRPFHGLASQWECLPDASRLATINRLFHRLRPGTQFVALGGTSGSTSESRRMTFTDTSIPTSAAAAGAQYIVTGQRGTRIGESSDAITVQFGTDGGSFNANNSPAAIKIAA